MQRLEGLLFVLVSWEDGEGQRDSIAVREHSHLDDRVRAVFFALPIFFCTVFLLDLKVIVGAVVIKDAVIPVYQEVAVLESFRLNKVAFLGKDIQGAVDVMFFIGRFFEVVHGCPVGGALAAGLQYPGIDQIGQDGVEIIVESVPVPDLSADFVKSESVVYVYGL